MLLSNQSKVDYYERCCKALEKFNHDKIYNGLDYKEHQKEYHAVIYTLISNNEKSFILLYDKDQRTIIEKSVYSFELKVINELQNQLNGGK